MKVKSKIFTCPNQYNYLNKRGMSGIITSVIIIGIALAAIGIVWYVINTVVNEQTSQVENSSSKVFQSCKDAGYYKMNTGDVCQGMISYLGGEKCCQSNLIPTLGLISYWSFDVNASDDWGDNDGTANGTTWSSTGGFNEKGAYEFDGVDDYIQMSLPLGAEVPNEVSIGSWFKRKRDGTDEYVLDSDGDETSIRIFSNDKIWCEYWNGSKIQYVESTGTIADTSWHHAYCTFDYGNYINLYIDGVLNNSNTNPNGTLANYIINFWVGKRASSVKYFNGTIDEIRMYNRVLSADEVKALYELS